MDEARPSPFLRALFVILATVVLGVLIAAIGIGSNFLEDCPIQPYIPIYLIVLGVLVLLTLMVSLGSFCGPMIKDNHEMALLSLLLIGISFILYLFVVCWFIAGSVWIYTVYPPSYEPTSGEHYCQKTLYLFAFCLNTVCYGCLAVLLLCCGYLVLYTCMKNSFQRAQPFASISQQQPQQSV